MTDTERILSLRKFYQSTTKEQMMTMLLSFAYLAADNDNNQKAIEKLIEEKEVLKENGLI